jgi:hypothetical protein
MNAHLQRVGGFALQQQREMPPRSIPLFSDVDARLAHRLEAELLEATPDQDGACVRSARRRGGVDTPTGEVHAASARSTFDIVSATNLRPINDRAEPSASA